jgi:hypothetical protein
MLDAPKPGDNSGKDPELGVTPDEFMKILDNIAGKAAVMGEANGELRSAIKSTLDNYGWHKGALAMIRTIEAMSPTKRADFLRTFDPMFELMYLKKWRDEGRDLIPDDDPEDGGDED